MSHRKMTGDQSRDSTKGQGWIEFSYDYLQEWNITGSDLLKDSYIIKPHCIVGDTSHKL